jgi:hypothetical protein
MSQQQREGERLFLKTGILLGKTSGSGEPRVMAEFNQKPPCRLLQGKFNIIQLNQRQKQNPS